MKANCDGMRGMEWNERWGMGLNLNPTSEKGGGWTDSDSLVWLGLTAQRWLVTHERMVYGPIVGLCNIYNVGVLANPPRRVCLYF